ncbi:hypothetical protein SDC9_157777 [bioreactor metagenome]|uniref:Uncharacterized protein n=1 Tax=bioreactor metagenome TaxID=1076179 RepID=A0A645FA97_9ZZZZ
MLDDGRTGIDPVAAIHIGQAADVADRGPVDMAADHAVQPPFPGVVDGRFLEIENEIECRLHLALGVAGQRPVAGNTQLAAPPRQPVIGTHQQVVSLVAQDGHPAVMTRHLIELVAVDEQEATAVDRLMDDFVDHLDIAEDDAAILAQRLVVVAGNEHHPLAMPRPAQQLLDHRVLRLRPADAATHRPEVDDVADQVSPFGGMLAEELEKTLRLARPRAEVDVGKKDGSDLGHRTKIRPARDRLVTGGLRFDGSPRNGKAFARPRPNSARTGLRGWTFHPA